MNAIDTNVFIYALDGDDPKKQVLARGLFDRLISSSEGTILLWQVAGELLANLRKRESSGRISAEDVEAHFTDFHAMFPLVVPNAKALSAYFKFRSKFSLSHWDAMLLAACQVAGVTILFSEDMEHATNYDGISIVNPFA